MFGAGLPSAVDAERLVLGSIMIGQAMHDLRGVIEPDDWSLEVHRRIWDAMCGVYDAGGLVDRIVVSRALIDRGELETVGGLSYIVSLDDGLPRISNLDAYVRILKDKAMLRRIIYAGQHLQSRALSGDEPQRILDDASQTIMDLAPRELEKDPTSTGELVERVGLEQLLAPRRDHGITLPWGRLDSMLCGLQPGQMVTLAAWTSNGKTSLALQIARRAAKQTGVVFVSLEMSKAQLFRRLIHQDTRIDADRVRHGVLTPDERERMRSAAGKLTELPMYFDEQANSMPAIHAAVRKIRCQRPVGLVVVDYLQRVSPVGRFGTRAQEVSALSRSMKTAAMEFGCPFLVLSQVKRPLDNHDPTLFDLKESGDIENDSDVALFIHKGRDDAGSLRPETDPHILQRDVYIAKQREGVRDVRCEMVFFSQFQTFGEIG